VIHKETSVSSTRLRQKNENRSGCVRLCNRRMLSMECEDGRWRLVVYLSKLLNEMERNYEIYDKEILAIIRGLENWRHLLEGT